MEDYGKQMIKKITEIVCDYFKVDPVLLKSKTKKGNVVKCRQISQELSFRLIPEASSSFVGKHVGLRNHSTVLYSIKTVNNLRETDKKYDTGYLNIEEKIFSLFDKSFLEYKLSSLKLDLERAYKKSHNLAYEPESEVYLNEYMRDVSTFIERAIKEMVKLG